MKNKMIATCRQQMFLYVPNKIIIHKSCLLKCTNITIYKLYLNQIIYIKLCNNNKQRDLMLLVYMCYYQCSHSKGRLGAENSYAICNINYFRTEICHLRNVKSTCNTHKYIYLQAQERCN